jgi:hypothetical protein
MSIPIHELFHVEPNGADLLFMGPVTECVCGEQVFHALIWFADDRTIGGYITEMVCSGCGALVRGATEIDDLDPAPGSLK